MSSFFMSHQLSLVICRQNTQLNGRQHISYLISFHVCLSSICPHTASNMGDGWSNLCCMGGTMVEVVCKPRGGLLFSGHGALGRGGHGGGGLRGAILVQLESCHSTFQDKSFMLICNPHCFAISSSFSTSTDWVIRRT